MTTSAAAKATYQVIDAYEHPHGGRILRLRLRRGEALSVKELKGTGLVATSPEGEEKRIGVHRFALFGGKPGDARFARTGRVDIHVTGEVAGGVRPGWLLSGPA